MCESVHVTQYLENQKLKYAHRMHSKIPEKKFYNLSKMVTKFVETATKLSMKHKHKHKDKLKDKRKDKHKHKTKLNE